MASSLPLAKPSTDLTDSCIFLCQSCQKLITLDTTLTGTVDTANLGINSVVSETLIDIVSYNSLYGMIHSLCYTIPVYNRNQLLISSSLPSCVLGCFDKILFLE